MIVFQNIDSLSISKLEYAINTVISSYEKKGNKNPQNIILIQTQTSDIVVSGVTFTREPSIGAPYFIINFDDGIASDSVTKGQPTKTIKIQKNTIISKIPKKWKKLIYSLKEIESVIKNDFLDIEFAITKHNKNNNFSSKTDYYWKRTSCQWYRKKKFFNLLRKTKKNIMHYQDLPS